MHRVALALGMVTSVSAVAGAQTTAPLEHVAVALKIDSGLVHNTARTRGVIYAALAEAPGASWMRLEFAQVQLGRTPVDGQPTVVRLTSILDGASQTMHSSHVAQWRNTSAYFNGDAVRIEVIADAGAPPSRIVIEQAQAGMTTVGDEGGEGGIASLCGADDRVLSSDPRTARIVPIGCTAWIIDDANHCMLSAGHCAGSSLSILEFNVPLSTSGGAIVHPPPHDQYAIDPDSVQFAADGLGSDWCYFGCFPNTETDLTAYEAQGNFYVLAAQTPAPAGQMTRITGFGGDSTPATHNQAQQTHVGPYTAVNGTVIHYQVDTTGGASGSAVVDQNSGEAFGIHTNGGCTNTGGTNKGCATSHPALQGALANPQGVCRPPRKIAFKWPDHLPPYLNPSGDSIRLEVSGANGGVLEPSSPTLHYDDGSGFIALAMTQVEPNVYDAIFPATRCQASITYYFSAQTTDGEMVTDPELAPSATHRALSAAALTNVFADSFELDQGWTASAEASVTSGFWQRGLPAGDGDRGDPTADADSSGQCYLTHNLAGNYDVDGGSVTLTSPLIDATAPNAALEYDRWFYTNSLIAQDSLVVEVSDSGGEPGSWQPLESFSGSEEAWIHRHWRIAEIPGIVPTNQFRVRFIASDFGTASLVEAGVDGFMVRSIACDKPIACPADLAPAQTPDGVVNVIDLLALLAAWGPCGEGACDADLDHNGAVNVHDLLAMISAWGPCS